MSTFHNLFTWEQRELKEKQCVFKKCTLCVPMANKKIGERVDIIVQDYLQCILIAKTFEGTIHIPYSLHIENLKPMIVYPDRVSQLLAERIDILEQKINLYTNNK